MAGSRGEPTTICNRRSESWQETGRHPPQRGIADTTRRGRLSLPDLLGRRGRLPAHGRAFPAFLGPRETGGAVQIGQQAGGAPQRPLISASPPVLKSVLAFRASRKVSAGR